MRALRFNLYAENAGAASDNARQLGRSIQFQAQRDPEAVAQRRGELPGARGRAYEREVRQVEAYRVGAGPFADDDIDGVVLHGGIKYLLHGAVQAVYLIHEQDVVLLQVRQERGQVTSLFDGRP